MATVEFDAQPQTAYRALERAGSLGLLDAIDDALDALEADPGDKQCRQRSFGQGRWGITVRNRADDWLIIWERDLAMEDLIHVRYLGPDPFA
jgi:hypothetical protein